MAASGEYRTAAVVGAESWNKSFIDDRFCQCTDVFMMIGGGEQGGQHVGTECADLTRYDRFEVAPARTRPNFAGARRRPVTSGQKCCALLVTSDRAGLLVKTLLASFQGGTTRSRRYAGTRA